MKLWNNLEKNKRLLDIIEKEQKDGNTINFGCKKFCEEYPSYNLKQVRAKYYQLKNSTKQINEQIIVKPWTLEEENFLLNYCEKEIGKGVNKTKIFFELSKKFNRSFNSVSGRYYILTNSKKENKISKKVDIDKFIKDLNSINLYEIKDLIDKLILLEENLKEKEKDILIIKLKNEKKDLENEILFLNKKLEKKERENRSLKLIIENYKEKEV